MATIYSLEERIKELEREIEQWKTWGIVEIAVRNPNVASYVEHWEKRAIKAEKENDKLRGILAQGKGDCVYCGLPAARTYAKVLHGFPGCDRDRTTIVNMHEAG